MDKKTISFKINQDLAERLEKVKVGYFNNNRNAAIVKAVEDLVAAYSGEGERDPPRLEAAKRQADYIRHVMLQGIDCDNTLRNEVLKLCQLVN